MYYEFYIDQFLLEHALTESLLLALAALLCRRRLGVFRIFAASGVGSAVMAALICTGYPGFWPVSLAAAGAAAFWPIRRTFGTELLSLLFVTVCFGGVLEALRELFGFPILAGSAAAAMVLRAGLLRWSGKRQAQSTAACVTLFWQGRSVEATGLIDTGNGLSEPLTGRPVSILSPELAQKLLPEGWEARKGFYLVPYHSIGREQGWMRAVTADWMCVRPEGETAEARTEAPVLAISEMPLSQSGEYQIILHPHHVSDVYRNDRQEIQEKQLRKKNIPKR